jgi:protein-L-isoaspartate O-methyltransferase
VIHSTAVEEGFRRVDRRFFVPTSLRSVSYSDQPLRQGAIHVSAPHIYGTILEALELTPNKSFSFLNAGSGTGYLSSMVAVILGPTSLSINIDCHAEAIAHSKVAVDEWKASMPDTKHLPDMQFLLGNVLNMDVNQGECLRGFDRIYVGAALEKSNLAPLASLLKVGGILVGPGKFRTARCFFWDGDWETSDWDQGLTHPFLNVYPLRSR